MGTALVNGRVDERVKRQAESVLAAHHKTASEAIRGLYQHIADTRQLPDFLTAADATKARHERERKLTALLSVAGISHSAAITTDEGTAETLEAEMRRRHG
ncbi:MAG: type II toxin-antitoxin system RelB/DinJ family antitoxin [Micrococcales bacterium]|nr:type II toxin-antitoxin system RelB/DinJ family antitoxin [Micrococcales bacterium]